MIQIKHLNFKYNHKHQLFNRLNLDLPSGNIYGLLGKNGAGKTTLLKLITGLLFPSEGHIQVINHDPKKRLPEFLREIYLVTEEFNLPSLKMDKYIQLYSPFYPRFNHGLFQGYLNEFKLPRDQKLSSMSYGQKKNFLISFGLATDCNLLILDEPTNGMDIPSKRQFRKIVANAIHEDRSFIISTHQVRDMENLIDPIIILDEGKVVFFENYERIASKLAITHQSKKPDIKTLIYSESSLGSYTVVKENTENEETNLNLELLFNAVINNTEKISELFKNQSNES